MVNKHKLGLVVGAALGLFHLVWAVLVAIGVAKPLMDWVYNLHSLRFSYQVLPFDPGMSLLLIVVTAIAGYVFGWVLGWLWNMANKR